MHIQHSMSQLCRPNFANLIIYIKELSLTPLATSTLLIDNVLQAACLLFESDLYVEGDCLQMRRASTRVFTRQHDAYANLGVVGPDLKSRCGPAVG